MAAVAAAALLQLRPNLQAESPPRAPHLEQAVPARIAGWESRDVPLGSNEFLTAEVGRILNFDEAVNREYRSGRSTVGVYVAYWGPGRMASQLVAAHTPDRCWTENGWRCLESRFRERRQVGDQWLQPAEWRIFEPSAGGAPTHVLYWHLVDGQVYESGDRFTAIPSLRQWLRHAVASALAGNPEQYFIRLTSSEPFEAVWEETGFAEILQGLSGLGLARPAPPSS